MATKQEQLEWLANKIVKWPNDVEVIEVGTDSFGKPMFWFSCWGEGGIKFTKEEWQKERDRLASKQIAE